MKAVYVAIGVVCIAVLASANIPSGPPTPPKPKTVCGGYTAMPHSERIQQWVNTLQSGLIKNPELAEEVWVCVMDYQKMVVTDKFVFDVCTDDPNADFEPVVFKGLEYHLDQCGIGIER